MLTVNKPQSGLRAKDVQISIMDQRTKIARWKPIHARCTIALRTLPRASLQVPDPQVSRFPESEDSTHPGQNIPITPGTGRDERFLIELLWNVRELSSSVHRHDCRGWLSECRCQGCPPGLVPGIKGL